MKMINLFSCQLFSSGTEFTVDDLSKRAVDTMDELKKLIPELNNSYFEILYKYATKINIMINPVIIPPREKVIKPRYVIFKTKNKLIAKSNFVLETSIILEKKINMPNPRARRALPASAAPSEAANVADTSQTTDINGPIAKTPVGDHEASVLHRVAPKYPVSALRNNDSGTVTVGIQVDADGKPDKVRIEKSSGSRDLDRAAREAVLQWQFSPKVENGSPVSSELLIPVEFKLDE